MSLEKYVSMKAEDGLEQLDLNTVLHADDLTTQRRRNYSLRHRSFLVSDMALYRFVEKNGDKKLVLYLVRGNNLIFKNLDKATKQLYDCDYFHITDEKTIEKIVKADTTICCSLNDAMEPEIGSESYRLLIKFNLDRELDELGLKIAQRIIGSGENYEKNRKMLLRLGIKNQYVHTLSPYFVSQLPNEGAFACACRLDDYGGGYWDGMLDAAFSNIHQFEAYVRCIPKPKPK